MSEKAKKIGAILYIVGFILGFLFVRNALKVKSVDVVTKQDVEQKPEVKKVTVSLNVKTGEITKTYQYTLTDKETVYDLLQFARKSGDVYFETTYYSDRTLIRFYDATGKIQYYDNEFLVGTPEQVKPTDGSDISAEIHTAKLTDGAIYTVRLTKIESAIPF